MPARWIASEDIKDASLHKRLPLLYHAYIAPFIVLYPIWAWVYFVKYDTYLKSEEWSFLGFTTLTAGHALTFLATQWSINVKCRLTARPARTLDEAQIIKVVPGANKGIGDICELVKRPRGDGKGLDYSFNFQRDKYEFDPGLGAFKRLAYPIDARPKVSTLLSSLATRGLTSDDGRLAALETMYGPNKFDIPIPTFLELFQEHAIAPFFVFQIFCVGLWCLDEYWYYSLFTLVMLVIFECTTVFQRQRTLMEFRGMSIKPFRIQCLRDQKWQPVSSDLLLPGDIVSLQRSDDDSSNPADMLLLAGSAIVNEAMLSGESTPLLKESIQLRAADDSIDIGEDGTDKNHIVWGGTKILQVSAPQSATSGTGDIPDTPAGIQTPDGGAPAMVLRTGFGTSQGSLVRTMIFSTERITANNWESFLFIAFLLVFAIAASAYVWIKGVESGRKKSKLLLDCVLIITSVVPPELPMELTMAVNSSLMALSKYAIFCTEPFRIPVAGRLEVLCFDKTGTITGEDLVVEGVAGVKGKGMELADIQDLDRETTLCLASAHALVLLDDELVGDPMEKATLEALDWQVGKGDVVQPTPPKTKAELEKERERREREALKKKLLYAPVKGAKTNGHVPNGAHGEEEAVAPLQSAASSRHKATIQIRRRFPFSSALKRMSSVSIVAEPGQSKRRVFVSAKGAPETLKTMFTHLPPRYEETYKEYTRKGSRVLALGYRWMDALGPEDINHLSRDRVESSLTFAGFMVFHCPLKPDAKETLLHLIESSHRCIMITGDNALTACHVARDVEIVDREVRIIDQRDGSSEENDLVFRSIDESIQIPIDLEMPIDKSILLNYDVCMTGTAVRALYGTRNWNDLIQSTWVYARVSPKQKEQIITSFKDLGYNTLMAGDGTNDVGALKQAHIGVALLNGNPEDLKRIAENQRIERTKKVYESQLKLTNRFHQPPPPVPPLLAHLYPDAVAAQKQLAVESSQARKQGQRQTFELSSIMDSLADVEDDASAPTIKLGDASVAAPFTSKLSNVAAIANIIRQGRCTLVATIQMYKILALNCLISAYSLSVLYLDGIKFGDYQATITGMLMSICFLCISRAKPVERLSRERPLTNIFNAYWLTSVLVQFAIHIAALLYITQLSTSIEPKEAVVDLEKAFKPSLLNTAIYLVSLSQQVSTFAINYQGRPFRESIHENPTLYYGLLSVEAIAISGTINFIPELNSWLQLVEMSFSFQMKLLATILLDFGLAWGIEVAAKAAFADTAPKAITRRAPRKDKNV